MNSSRQIFSGTSGLVTPVPKNEFPEPFDGKSRLHYYASLFNSIEINSSFYKLPQATTVKKWADIVPEDFRFTFKLLKTVTHSRGLAFNTHDVAAFINTISQVGNKQGCILVQFPPSVKYDKWYEVEAILTVIHELQSEQKWRVAVEFRDPLWYRRDVYKQLAHYSATVVLHDLPASAAPMNAAMGDVVYLRFHGTEPRYRGNYTTAQLSDYATMIKQWVADKRELYFYFNNTMGNAVGNLRELNDLIEK